METYSKWADVPEHLYNRASASGCTTNINAPRAGAHNTRKNIIKKRRCRNLCRMVWRALRGRYGSQVFETREPRQNGQDYVLTFRISGEQGRPRS